MSELQINSNIKNNPEYRKRRRRRRINLTIRYVILVFFAIVMLYPIFWLIGSTFKTNSEIWTEIKFWPNRIDFTAYVEGWKTKTGHTFGLYLLNTFRIVIPKVLFSIISCTITAYGFSRFSFRFKKPLFAALISTLFLPQVVLRIPMYIAWTGIGVVDSYIPLVLPSLFAVEAFFVFMLIQFFRGIPRELDEAATVDGCNSFMILIKILVPVLKPAIISAAFSLLMYKAAPLPKLKHSSLRASMEIDLEVIEITSIIKLMHRPLTFYCSRRNTLHKVLLRCEKYHYGRKYCDEGHCQYLIPVEIRSS